MNNCCFLAVKAMGIILGLLYFTKDDAKKTRETTEETTASKAVSATEATTATKATTATEPRASNQDLSKAYLNFELRRKEKQEQQIWNRKRLEREQEHIINGLNPVYLLENLKEGENYADKCAKNKKFLLWLSGMRDDAGELLNIRGTGINKKGKIFSAFERPYDVFRDMPVENQSDTFERWYRNENVIPILREWLSNTLDHGKGGRCRHETCLVPKK